MRFSDRVLSVVVSAMLLMQFVPFFSVHTQGAAVLPSAGDSLYPIVKLMTENGTKQKGVYSMTDTAISCGSYVYDQFGYELAHTDAVDDIYAISKTHYFILNGDDTYSAFQVESNKKDADYTEIIDKGGVIIAYDGETAYYYGDDGRHCLGLAEACNLGGGLISVINWNGQNEGTDELTYAERLEKLSKTDMSRVDVTVVDSRTGKTIKLDPSAIPLRFDEESDIILSVILDTDDIYNSKLASFDINGNILFGGRFAEFKTLSDNTFVTFSPDLSVTYITDEDGKHLLKWQNKLPRIPDDFTWNMNLSYSFTVPQASIGDYVIVLNITNSENDTPFSVYSKKSGKLIGKYAEAEVINSKKAYAVDSDGHCFIFSSVGEITESDCKYYSASPTGKTAVGKTSNYDFAALYDENLNKLPFSGNYDAVSAFDNVFITVKNGKAELVSLDGTVLISDKYDFGYYIGEFENGTMVFEFGRTKDDNADLYFVEFSQMPFVDVPVSSWFYNAIKDCVDDGIMVGINNREFRPNMKMTRAQLVTVMWRLSGSSTASAGSVFTDVPNDTWYSAPVAWATENGVVIGFENGEFRPDDAITRDQLAAILFRYTELTEGDVTCRGDLSQFTDEDSVREWAKDALSWAVGVGLIVGKRDGSKVLLAPKEFTTRAQVATVLTRFRAT